MTNKEIDKIEEEQLKITKEKDEKFNRLSEITKTIKQNHIKAKEINDLLEMQKSEVKNLFLELGINEFSNPEYNVKLVQTINDKSYYDQDRTMEWLKQNGFTKFIKTKEYFEDSELKYFSDNGAFDINLIEKYKIKKDSKTLYIR